jgi:hypothetical protein
MKEPTPRHRAPLIPTISTLEQEKPVEPDALAPEISQKVCVVVITVIDLGSEQPKPSP